MRSRRQTGSLTSVAAPPESDSRKRPHVEGLRAGRGTLGRLFTDDALYQELTGLVTSAEAVASNLNQGRGTLGRLVTDPAAARSSRHRSRIFRR